MKTNYKMRRGFTLVELLVVIVIIAALAGLTAPMVIRQRKKADQTEAVSNARQVGFAMFEFETEYGSFPDATLGEQINTNVGGTLVAPVKIESSNDAFTQLIAAGIASSEQMFFCKTAYSTIKPDNVYSKKDDTLKKGDVGFGYMMGTGSKAFSAAGNSGRVLIAAPLKYSSGSFTAKQFDKDVYDNKAVVLKMDNSVTSLPINKDGEAVLGGVKKLFDEGEDTVWGKDITITMVNPLGK
jgi:prepilin-type N-terminal cleavage/methylation domain-containing protein